MHFGMPLGSRTRDTIWHDGMRSEAEDGRDMHERGGQWGCSPHVETMSVRVAHAPGRIAS